MAKTIEQRKMQRMRQQQEEALEYSMCKNLSMGDFNRWVDVINNPNGRAKLRQYLDFC